MKLARFISIFIAALFLSISFSACGGSDDDNNKIQVAPTEYEPYLGSKCKDMTNLSSLDVTVLDDSRLNAICIMGLKQENLYIGIFEKNEPYTALLEWTDPSPLNKHLNVNMGYVSEIDFNALQLAQIVKYEQNYYIIGATDIKTDYDSVIDKIWVFSNKTKTYEGAFIAGQFSIWYDRYMLLSTGNEALVNPMYDGKVGSMIFSPQGIKLDEMTPQIITDLQHTKNNPIKLISYCEGIWANSQSHVDYYDWHGCRFYRKMFDKFVWDTYYDVSFDNTVIDELSLLDSSTNIWKYQLKLTYTNGDIKTTTIYVNIDNGEITAL